MDNELKITEITFEAGATVNVGNFENARVLLGARAAVPEGMSLHEATNELAARVRDELLKQVQLLDAKVDSNALQALRDIAETE